MNDKKHILLDWNSDSHLPEGYFCINTEIELLKGLLCNDKIYVIGDRLCRWVLNISLGRGWSCDDTKSLSQLILEICSELTLDQVKELVKSLESRGFTLPNKLNSLDLLRAIYPDGPWDRVPTLTHSARWLLWLSSTNNFDAKQPLIQNQVSCWNKMASDNIKIFYVATKIEAIKRLEQWFGMIELEPTITLPEFPTQIPQNWLQKVRQYLANQFTQTKGDFIDTVLKKKIPSCILEMAADEAIRFLKKHAEAITESRIDWLSSHASQDSIQSLRSIKPPNDPGDPPASISEVKTWFENYLAYRLWEAQYSHDSRKGRVDALARKFAEWILSYYPQALAGGNFGNMMAITRSESLQNADDEHVILFAVLDGMPYADARELHRKLTQRCPRLTVCEETPIIGVLPTVTQFAKPALLQGLPPGLVKQDRELARMSGVILEENKTPIALRSAKPGDFFVWRMLEPDHTYHGPGDSNTVRQYVKGKIEQISIRLSEAVEMVPDECKMRVVLTTDHGRLLADSERQMDIPKGMIGHGRAAWGQSNIKFSSNGTYIDDDIAYLSKDRFKLTDDCAIIMSDATFKTEDGRSGTERFPHGGLYPEEIMIPWVELRRDVMLLPLHCYVLGKGRARGVGEIRYSIHNPNDIYFTIHDFTLSCGNNEKIFISIDKRINPKSSLSGSVAWDKWPTHQNAGTRTGTLLFSQPSGRRDMSEFSAQIESQDIYTRKDDLLGEL